MDTSSAVINSQVNSKQYHYSSDSSDLIEPWTVARDGRVPIPAAECCGAIVKIIMGLRSVSTSKDVIVERKTPMRHSQAAHSSTRGAYDVRTTCSSICSRALPHGVASSANCPHPAKDGHVTCLRY